jgi:hypothetical protein
MTYSPRATAVTYVGLPISSGGAHSLGRMSRRVAHERTIAFLQACTQTVEAIAYSFAVIDVPELAPIPHLERELLRRFGNYKSVQEPRVEDALIFLDEIDPQPTNRWGLAPVWFTATSHFLILDPATAEPMPGQDPDRFLGVEYEWGVPLGSSLLRLSLHNQAVLAIDLCMPDADEEALRRIVPWLQQHLPCKLSSNHWRAWTPTKTASFKARRLAAPQAIR